MTTPRKVTFVDETVRVASYLKRKGKVKGEDNNGDQSQFDGRFEVIYDAEEQQDQNTSHPPANRSYLLPPLVYSGGLTPDSLADRELAEGSPSASYSPGKSMTGFTSCQPLESLLSVRVDSSFRRSGRRSLDLIPGIPRALVNHPDIPNQKVSDDLRVFRLLRHYVEVIGPWLDTTDEQHHFSRLVPQIAMQCPVLFNAILAFSARQLHRLTGYDPLVAEYYHGQAIKAMIPMLQDPLVAPEGKVLAATVLLRMYEMLEREEIRLSKFQRSRLLSPASEDEMQNYLSGGCSLVSLGDLDAECDELRLAAFWLYLRQDISVAQRYRRPTRMNLDACFVGQLDFSLPAEAGTWANRIHWVFAKAINVCFGPNGNPSVLDWNMLHCEADQWRECLPPSFNPYLYVEPEPDSAVPFPLTGLLSDLHVSAFQTYLMTKLLLALHPPKKGKGVNGLRLQREQEIEILAQARQVCGISVTNTCEGARICAVQSLWLAGQCLVMPQERQKLVEVLREIQAATTWPTEYIAKALIAEWGIDTWSQKGGDCA